MRGRLKVLCPWAFGVLMVLLAVYGSKGSPLYILHPVSKLSEVRSLPRRLLSLETETPPSLPFGMEVELGPSILAPHEPLKAERPAMVPQHSEGASPPHPSDVESTPAAPEGSVPRPPTILPKSEVLPHNIQSVVPPTQLSPAPDHSSSPAKSERIASPSPSITRHAASSKSLVSPPEPQVVIPPAMTPIFAPGHLTSNMRPKAMIPPSPSVASPPPSVPDSEEQARSGAPGAGFDAKPPTLISSPNVDKVRSGAPIAAPPREEHDNPFPIKHSQPNASSVAPASIASPAIRRNGNALSPPSSHLSPPSNLQPERPVTSPPSAISPDTGKDRHDMPIAASPNPLSSHVNQMNHSHSKDYTISPTPITSPTYRRKHMPVVAPPPSSSPGFDHPNYTHPKGPTVSPIPPMPPVENRRYGMPVAAPPKDIFSHLTPAHHRHEKAISPSPHGVEEPVHDVHAPFSSHSQPPSGNVPARPSSGPVASFHHSIGRGRAGNPTPAPSHLIPWPHHQARPPNYRPNHHAPPPHEQARPPNERPNHSAPPPHEQEPNDGVPASSPSALIPSIHNKSSSPAQSPAPPPHEQEPNDGVPASSPSTLIPSIHNKSSSPAQSPASPPDSISGTPSPSLPQPLPIHALPPPPPNLDCTPLSCAEPLTNSPPGSPCACVMPINVELQLSIGLYTFFPLVSEFAQEIASGVSMKQSQVRVMGANAANEEPEKTIVLVDLVPLKETFDSNTAFQVYEEFWLKHIFINPTHFVDYEVIYVHYPGLPPSPPTAPGNLNFDDGTFGNGNRPKMMHPFAVDVRKQKDKRNGAIIAIVVLSSVIALIVCLAVAWLLIFKCRRHSQLPIATGQAVHHLSAKAAGVGTGSAISGSKKSSASASFSSSIATYTGSAKTFTLAEMERATNKFDDSKIIGEGGFGRVYEGTLDDGMRVAIKILKRDDQQGSREFLAEVEMLSRLHHRNLIKLIGICIEESTRCLVYELVPNGSVESHLHGMDKEITPLDWRTRLKIALGAARGLAYLHEDSSPRVIHRDFKSSNILLEEDFTPKVSDFGLARTALDGGKEYISTRVMGTFGYVAPEYAMTGHLLVKSDVYSYGVVLLELLTGRKPVDMMRPPGQENLVTWARPLLTSKDSLESILDPSLGTTVPFHSMAKVAAIASMCVQPEVDQRPFMGEVVQALKLVFDEENGCGGSGSCTLEDIVQENESGTGLDLETERTLSVYDVFNTSARFLRDMSGSFRRFSSSGPLRPGSKTQYLGRERRVSTGSTSEHGRFGASSKGGKDWM